MSSLPIAALAMLALGASTMSPQASGSTDVRAQLLFAKSSERHHAPAAVLWLKPIQETPAAPFVSSQIYTLLQKDRTFKPHLLVVPVGGVVQFPNADPFFHNVFSLFDGKRFDLGLYEAGSTKSVTFSREGVSYIFCNIHPEMSAVILALPTRLYAKADSSGRFRLAEVPEGEYELHVWVEGVQQPALNGLTRRIHLTGTAADLGKIEVPGGIPPATTHTNMYGKPYDRETRPAY
jgi:plastocyanin